MITIKLFLVEHHQEINDFIMKSYYAWMYVNSLPFPIK